MNQSDAAAGGPSPAVEGDPASEGDLREQLDDMSAREQPGHEDDVDTEGDPGAQMNAEGNVPG